MVTVAEIATSTPGLITALVAAGVLTMNGDKGPPPPGIMRPNTIPQSTPYVPVIELYVAVLLPVSPFHVTTAISVAITSPLTSCDD
jgi:hypothetical protein